jgi:hypothetical protein
MRHGIITLCLGFSIFCLPALSYTLAADEPVFAPADVYQPAPIIYETQQSPTFTPIREYTPVYLPEYSATPIYEPVTLPKTPSISPSSYIAKEPIVSYKPVTPIIQVPYTTSNYEFVAPTITGSQTIPKTSNTPDIITPTIPTIGATPSMVEPNPNGLITSFPDDSNQSNRAYTYDQAIAVKYDLAINDPNAASNILSYYETSRRMYKFTPDGQNNPGAAFFTSYNVNEGAFQSTSVTEDLMQTGSNAWLGLAAVQYDQNTGTQKYAALAGDIGDYFVAISGCDNGNPGLVQDPRYGSAVKSTEENIDAYVFLNQLGKVTGDPDYAQTASSTKTYIAGMYNQEANYFNVSSDGTDINTAFATDVQSMAIMAFGKSGLEAMGVNVSDFVDSVEKNGTVTTTYTKPSGESVTVTAFGFTGGDNKISVEWSSQMVIAYLVLADDFDKAGNQTTADTCRGKAHNLLTEIGKLEDDNGNLPYSTHQDAVIMSNGDWTWKTPLGTKSLSATAYYNLAKAGDNPYTSKVENLWK